ncbi:hypothetical protein LTR36_010544 [Oleoguttula mirabilis]|uniref:Uncharacterized protein n=1 Tax=Oleoguttula mirabilis TaxID=1507867 RepID=A0AAV9JQX0_9PEZI|nr:hypothetical protein LTR36_010544 [Oleoguttula mirabilis]
MADCSSPSPFSHPSPGWHFPFGPSSRYHQRERPKPTRLVKSTYTTPVAPVLSTERRAQRRAQSYQATNPHPPPHAHAPATWTPPASEHSRSPLGRYSSYTAPTPPATTMAAPPPPAGLVTPAKERPAHFFDMQTQDSPFSDYFTDDARSVDHHYNSNNDLNTAGGASYHAPSSETQQLLVRLSKLQAHVMRAGEWERDVLNIVGRKLGEIDEELEARHSQTRLPADLEDSGLFMDDEEVEEVGEVEEEAEEQTAADARRPGSREEENGGVLCSRAHDGVTAENRRAERDYQLVEAQRVLENVAKAQEELRKRHSELVQLNDTHVLQIEAREREAERLRAENEGLKSDLGRDRGELLLLKLQLESLGGEAGAPADDDEAGPAHSGEESRAGTGTRRVRCGGVVGVEDIARWRRDWRDVEARLDARRSEDDGLRNDRRTPRSGSTAFGVAAGDDDDDEEEEEEEEGGGWRVEAVREEDHAGGERVARITICRRQRPRGRRGDGLWRQDQPLAYGCGLDGAAEDDAERPREREREESGEVGGAVEQNGAPAACCQTASTSLRLGNSAEQRACQTKEPEAARQTAGFAEYMERGTQTEGHHHNRASGHELRVPTKLLSENYGREHNENEEEEEGCASETGSREDEDECAITTSASTAEPSPVLQPQHQAPPKSPTKSAWAELWEGLGQFAGVGEA